MDKNEALDTVRTVIVASIIGTIVLFISVMIFLSTHVGEYTCDEDDRCWRDGPTYLELLIKDRG